MLTDERRAEIVRSMEQGPYMWTAEGEELLAELDRLRAMEDKLPKTADGVAVVPGMMVWYRTGHHVVHRTVEMRAQLRNMACMSVSGCYSTREAAEAAKEPK